MENGLNEAKLRSSRARDLNQDTRAGELELKKINAGEVETQGTSTHSPFKLNKKCTIYDRHHKL